MSESNRTETTQSSGKFSLPHCYDYTPLNNLIAVGVARAILTLIVFALCVADLADLSFYQPTGVNTVFSLLVASNLIHFLISVFFIYLGRNGDPGPLKFWFISDTILSVVFVILAIVDMCFESDNSAAIILGIKFIILTILLSLRFLVKYCEYLEQPIQMQLLTNEQTA